MGIINSIYNATLEYINTKPKTERKKIGQFFTPPPVAEFMASLAEFTDEEIALLDPGAGSGILTGALCDAIIANSNIRKVHATLYENNIDVLPVLNTNMELIKAHMQKNGKEFFYKIVDSNFITANGLFWRNELGAEENYYDVIIANPPYKKIGKSDQEAIEMESIVYGQPNIYFLFMAMAAKMLKEDGQMIFINPRSFSSGAYFQKFRQWFFENIKLSHLHLFVSREDVFNCDSVLQETIILKAVKTKKNISNITVTETENLMMFESIKRFQVPYEIVVSNEEERFMLIPTKSEDTDIISFMKAWPETLISLGYKLKTGPVVDFRATEFLKEENEENTVPLFWPYNYDGYRIKYPVKNAKKPQFIIDSDKSKYLLLKNEDYIFVKRFTSKEENRRIQSAIYLESEFDESFIGIENHLNYITKIHGKFQPEELYGLFVILNSSYIDKYFRILNGSTQVNANEMNTMPFPSKQDIIELGKVALNTQFLSVEECDRILENKFGSAELKNVG